MPKEEWGTKRVCPTTGKRFYDLGKSPIVSPYSGEVVTLETGKGARTMVADKADRSNKKKEVVEDDDEVVLEDSDAAEGEADDDVLEDNDDDDVSLDDIADVSSDEDES